MRIIALVALLALGACSRGAPWHQTDIAGAMPKLEFAMTRASDGAEVGAGDYRGRVVLVYFGYTHCPDVCPATLANLADVLQRLGASARDVRVLFVTVDPQRDTLAVLKPYVAAFAPQIDGLRGSADALANLARRYRVAYAVTAASPGHPYQVMHSSAVFTFDRQGRARLVTTDTSDTAGIAADLARLLAGE